MSAGTKRPANGEADSTSNKRAKTKKQWRTPNHTEAKIIQPGDSGIWVTCAQYKEALCVTALRELFTHFAQKMYGIDANDDEANEAADSLDVADAIDAELKSIKKPGKQPLFTSVKIDAKCVLFFKTRSPVEPVAFVKNICEEAMDDPSSNNLIRKWTRFVKRMTPVTVMTRASDEGVEKAANEVIPPHFHDESENYHKFAIRCNLRSHNQLKRDDIIRKVAQVVGEGHRVDLERPEKLILVELYKNVCGMAVVDSSYERLKRFNIGEIFEPTPKDLPGNPRKKVRGEASWQKSAESIVPLEVDQNNGTI